MSADWKPSITLEDGANVVLLIGRARKMLAQFKTVEEAERFHDEAYATRSYDDAKRCIEKYLDVRWEST